MNKTKNVISTGVLAANEYEWSTNLNLNFSPSKMMVTRVTVISEIGVDPENIYAIYMSGSIDPIAEILIDGVSETFLHRDKIWISGPLLGTTNVRIIGQSGSTALGPNSTATITLHLRFEE